MSQKNQKKHKLRKQEEILSSKKLDSLSWSIQNPLKFSLALASIWFIIMFALSIGIHYSNSKGYLWAINTSALIVFVISLLWVMIRIGVLESVLYRYKNYSDKKMSTKYKIKVEKITIEKYRERRSKKSWWGNILLSSLTFLIFIITLMIQLI